MKPNGSKIPSPNSPRLSGQRHHEVDISLLCCLLLYNVNTMSASFFPPSKLKPCQEDALGGASDVAEESKVIFFFFIERWGREKRKRNLQNKSNQSFNLAWLIFLRTFSNSNPGLRMKTIVFYSWGEDVSRPPVHLQTKHRHSSVKHVKHECVQKAKNRQILISIAAAPDVRKYRCQIKWAGAGGGGGGGRCLSGVALSLRASGADFLAFPLSERRREQACHLTVSLPLCTLQMWLWQTMNHQLVGGKLGWSTMGSS